MLFILSFTSLPSKVQGTKTQKFKYKTENKIKLKQKTSSLSKNDKNYAIIIKRKNIRPMRVKFLLTKLRTGLRFVAPPKA